MTKIDWAPQLDYNNVLIRPKRSSLVSRSQVNLERTFVYSKNIESLNVDNSNEWKGIPIIAANMDSTGTFGVYEVLSKFKIITAMNKFYTVNDFENYMKEAVQIDWNKTGKNISIPQNVNIHTKATAYAHLAKYAYLGCRIGNLVAVLRCHPDLS